MPAIWVSRLKIDIIGKLYSSKNKQLMIKSLCSFSDSFMFLGIWSNCYSITTDSYCRQIVLHYDIVSKADCFIPNLSMLYIYIITNLPEIYLFLIFSEPNCPKFLIF